VQSVILAVRQIRGEMNIAPSRRIPLLLRDASAQDKTNAEVFRPYLERLAGLDSITVLERGAAVPQSATALVGELTLLVPMQGLIDAAAEAERLSKVLAKAQQDIAKMRAKLSNENFVRNAPPEVVTKDRERQAELERAITGLTAQLERVRGLLAP
jgi:valyl-tRNA synthetase